MIKQIDQFLSSGQLKEAAVLIEDALKNGVDLQGRHITYANVLMQCCAWDKIATLMPEDTNTLITSGWIKSLAHGRPLNYKNEPIPWITYPAIDFLDSIVKRNWKTFEWGAGNSTLWWASKVDSVVSIEDNIVWYKEIISKMPSNAFVCNHVDKLEYANSIRSYPDKSFDVIVIDGSHRNDCAKKSINKLKDSGIIVFDNSDSSEYNESMVFLNNNGFFRIDFWGLIPSYMYKNCTSVFCRDSSLFTGAPPPSRHVSSVGISCFQAIEKINKPSTLDTTIPPEASKDEFYSVIKKLAAESHVKNILEIGSSAGSGSTEAFVSGLRDNPHHPHLFCIEISRPRFAELQQRYASESFVHCYNVSSVPISRFPSEKEVELFYRWVPSTLNHSPVEEVIGRLRQDIDSVDSSGVLQDGIQKIKRERNIATFDMVLIDGSEFTGMAELEEVYGAEYILLDGINGFKNRNNYQRLKEDPDYNLMQENLSVRNGYAVFKKESREPLPIHFFTIVLNGEPFIRYHIDAFKKLPFRWHWHVVEGVADHTHDTSWCKRSGGHITNELHDNGLSNDGTSQYLDWLAENFPENVTIYRKSGGAYWDGKLEMVMAPLPHITEECLLWQVDSDELWTTEQLITSRSMFLADPSKTAAFYTCTFFVGLRLITTNRGCYGNHTGSEWLRTWRYRPEDVWLTHSPPQLCRRNEQGEWFDVARVNPFTNTETELEELLFQHYAYATESQLRFKELYYGYTGAAGRWQTLQTTSHFPVKLSDYFAWVHDGTLVDTIESCGIEPLFTALTEFSSGERTQSRQILIIRTDTIGDNVLFMPALPYLREKYSDAIITICCQDVVADLYEACPLVDMVIPFNHFRAFSDENYREQVMEQLKEVKADIVINAAFTRQLLNEYFSLGCGAVEKIGFHGDLCELSRETRDADNRLYTRLIDSPGENKPELERNRDLLAGLGVAAPDLAPQLWTKPEDAGFAETFFVDRQLDPAKTIALFVTGRHEGKQYLRYPDALGGICREHGFSVIAFGASRDSEVSALALDMPEVRTINLCGDLSLRQSAEIIRRCRCAVGADTGLSHIACAVGTPHVVVLWGGHFGRFFPYSSLTTTVCLPLECYGCNWKCPYPRWHCVKDIDPRVIEFAISETLEKRSATSLVVCQHASLWDKPAKGPEWMSCTERLDTGKVTVLSPCEPDFHRLPSKLNL